eukprot:gene13003-17433_t
MLRQHIPSYANDTVDNDTYKRLQHLVSPHVESFNYLLEQGLSDAMDNIPAMEMGLVDDITKSTTKLPSGTINMKFLSASVSYPLHKDDVIDNNITPREARESGLSYAGSLISTVKIDMYDGNTVTISVKMGELPIMVMSDRCHLKGLSHKQLIGLKEEANEVGGYFIVNGIERVIRLLQVPRRNYATAIERNSYKNRGASYSDKGVAMRCVRNDQSSVTVTLHYLNNGGATLKFVLRKQEFLLPVVLVAKALSDISDKEIFDRIVQGDTNNTFLTVRLELLLRDFKSYKLYTKSQCQSYLGALFRLFLPVTDNTSDEEAGKMLIEEYLFVHTNSFTDKLETLFHMLRKLFSFAQGNCVSDNADALMNHELLLPGHLITMYLKEKMSELLLSVRQAIQRDYKTNKNKCISDCKQAKYYQKQFDRFGAGIGSKIATFLSTGNIVSSTGLDLMQVSGYTIVAERLNIFRYMSHFQSVHRGQFFTTMKTTAVRKLLPESWSFLCPVHTPDGGPCGLLNHMAKDVSVISFPTSARMPTNANRDITVPEEWNMEGINSKTNIQALLTYLGMIPSGCGSGDGQIILTSDYMAVLIDGVVIGGVLNSSAKLLVQQLRLIKTICSNPTHNNDNNEFYNRIRTNRSLQLDPTIEIAFFPQLNKGGPYPGLYLSTQPGRMVRPVIQLDTRLIEWIGPMEQVFMDIACTNNDIRPETTHLEISPVNMLSQIASLTPYSDYNQSPRNMYQCQMGKQTMGTPAHALRYRSDNKLYRIQNTQAPIVQTSTQSEYCMDEYPQGVNAVVAVISYTGYDMEDAMIINKAAYERGFGHGSVYKTTIIDLAEEEKRATSFPNSTTPSLIFSNLRVDSNGNAIEEGFTSNKYVEELDFDGLPFEGTCVEYGMPICCIVDTNTQEHRVINHKDNERAYVQTVRVIATTSNRTKKASLRKVSITLRYRRNPVIGDKFSSRHGQKGTLSVLWPQENMPFSESGISPDVLINPHAFPSRMTIGMLVESMAGKSGAMYGVYQDSTPFQFHEKRKVIDYLGEQLRLRHMVSDKSQVRSTGPVMAITRQPVKGRKKHGGIRLGEMERDALLSHGVAFCLHD